MFTRLDLFVRICSTEYFYTIPVVTLPSPISEYLARKRIPWNREEYIYRMNPITFAIVRAHARETAPEGPECDV